MSREPQCVFEARNVCGEGPVWDDEAQALYWVDIPEKRIFRRDEASGSVESWPVPADIGAIALRRSGGLIAGLRSGFALVDLDKETCEIFASPEDGLADNRLNDGKCDPRGRFWCGSLHDEADPAKRRPIGRVYRVDPDLACTAIIEGVKTTNGIDWSPDGRTLYFTDTPTLKIMAYEFDMDSGSIGTPRVFAEVPPGNGRPDGVAVDSEGFLWSAHFDGWRVTRYAPDGSIDRVLSLPVQNVTSCAFGGPDLRTLYITSATEDLSPEDLAAQPLAGGLFACRPGVQGRPMNRFAG